MDSMIYRMAGAFRDFALTMAGGRRVALGAPVDLSHLRIRSPRPLCEGEKRAMTRLDEHRKTWAKTPFNTARREKIEERQRRRRIARLAKNPPKASEIARDRLRQRGFASA